MKKPTTKVGQTGDLQAIREKMQSVNSEFKSELEKVLTEEQLAKLDKWQKSQQNRMRGGDRSGGRNRGEGGERRGGGRRGGDRRDRSQN